MNFCFIVLALIIGTSLSSPTSKKQKSRSHTSKNTKVANDDDGWEFENKTAVDTRRILYSKRVGIGKRPYMVYLQLTQESAKAHKYRGWLCGGVIVHRNYVLTSAACVEDADHFYIVSGTTKFVDSFDYKTDKCVCQNRRKVVWKCIPKNYKFDFQDSIKWSSNDIAIVKVNKPFKLGVCENGCEFAAQAIDYNNISRDLEKAGTKGYIAGWGSNNTFREGVYRRQSDRIPENSKTLQEAKVCIMDNQHCAKKWAQKFRNIINEYMICTKDVMKRMSEACDKRYANCTDVERRRQSGGSEDIDLGRHFLDPDDASARRSTMQGGFCENDHGGPLIVKYRGKDRVIGIISACKIDPQSRGCHGPFLYTSVFKNRQFLSCSIHKDVEQECRRVFRTGVTHEEYTVNWDNVKEDDDDQNDDDHDDDDRNDDDQNEEADASDENDNKASASEEESKESLRIKSNGTDTNEENAEMSAETEKNKETKIKTGIVDEDKAVEGDEDKAGDGDENIQKAKRSRNKKHKIKKDKKNKNKKKKKPRKSKKVKLSNINKIEKEVENTNQDKPNASYESSKEENVNEPENN